MSNADDWTPAVGWRKAAIQMPLRTVAAAVVVAGGFWLLKILVEYLGREAGGGAGRVGIWALILFGLVAGLLAGVILVARLSDATGLFGLHLLIPVCGLYIVALVLLYRGLVAVAPPWDHCALVMLAASGATGMAVACRDLLLNS